MGPGDDISAITPSATPVNAFLFGSTGPTPDSGAPRYPIQRSRDVLLLQLLFSIRISQRERSRDYCPTVRDRLRVRIFHFGSFSIVCTRHLNQDNVSEGKLSFRCVPDRYTQTGTMPSHSFQDVRSDSTYEDANSGILSELYTQQCQVQCRGFELSDDKSLIIRN